MSSLSWLLVGVGFGMVLTGLWARAIQARVATLEAAVRRLQGESTGHAHSINDARRASERDELSPEQRAVTNMLAQRGFRAAQLGGFDKLEEEERREREAQ